MNSPSTNALANSHANANALLQQATAAESVGDTVRALVAYRALIVIDADHPGALLRLAQAALRDHATPQHVALAMLERAAHAAQARGFGAQALPIYTERILALRSAAPAQRLVVVREALAACGEVPGLIWEECECLRSLGQHQPRLQRLNRLAALQPNDAAVLAALGLALFNSNSASQAMEPMRRAIALGFSDEEFSLSLAAIELQNGQFTEAKQRLDALHHANPTHFGALGLRWYLAVQCCDWERTETLEIELLKRIDEGAAHAVLSPWRLLASRASAAQLKRYAQSLAAMQTANVSAALPPLWKSGPRNPSHRIRVAYLSSDFHQHATALLMAGLFESHDRARFETFAYSYGVRVNDRYRDRLKNAFEHWHEINNHSDAEAAQLIASHQIDVLIELKGHTSGVRPGIVALRPAPVQAHYLGYPGTLAMEGVDFFIADAVTVPPGCEHEFVEQVIRLEGSYQANDPQRERPVASTRSAAGLPDDAIVLCNFNQSWKWRREFVEIWMRALVAEPKAVLWLLAPSHDHPAKEHIEAEALRFGVKARVVWAPKLPPDAHLSRLALADLALDQWPCNSHTTAADALWMGVPVLTCLGARFDGRVAASVTQTFDSNLAVTHSLLEYETALLRCVSEHRTRRLDAAHPANHAKHDPVNRNMFEFPEHWETMLARLAELSKRG